MSFGFGSAVPRAALAAAGGGPVTYATWNPADKSSDIALSNGDLTATAVNTGWRCLRATIGLTSGKWRWKCDNAAAAYTAVGVGTTGQSLASPIWGFDTGWSRASHAFDNYNGSYYGPSGPTWGPSAVIDCYLDLDANNFHVYVDGVFATTISISGRGANAVYPMAATYDTGNAITANFGQSDLGVAILPGYNSGVYTP